jgi:UDP-N-acetylglucosamine acyltransferase
MQRVALVREIVNHAASLEPPTTHGGANDRRVQIHPTAVVEDGVRIGAGSIIHAHAFIRRHSELGENVVVHPFAVVGGDPQDLRFDSAVVSGVRVGPGTVIREHVTINRATKAGTFTEVGANCFLMSAAHVAHDCRVGSRVVMANAVLLGGHVHVGDRAFLGGSAVVHQFCRIGEDVMLGGGARLSQDVPPYSLVSERNALIGLNVIGLRRRGLERAAFREIKRVFRLINSGAGNPREKAAAILLTGEFTSAEAHRLLEFYGEGRRGIVRTRRGAAGEPETAE